MGVIFSHEFKFSLNNYLKNDVQHCETESGRNISNLSDIIKFNKLNPPTEGYGQNLLERSQATDGIQNKTYLSAKNENHKKSIRFLESIFEKYDIDAIATPCHPDEPRDLFSYGAIAGYPSISVGMKGGDRR